MTEMSFAIFAVVLLGLVAGSSGEGQKDKYCQICPEHTMCLYEGPGSSCEDIGEGGVTDEEKQLIVDTHNKYRRLVATGGEERGAGGNQPQGANIMKMQWDEELATIAQTWADQCTFEHDACRDSERFAVGQNIYWSWDAPVTTGANWTTALDSWYDEVALFEPRNVKRFRFSPHSGHYSQMIWHNSYLVGCGRRNYGENKIYVCNYGPAGNSLRKRVYTIGEPCSKCPRGTFCSENLCEKKPTRRTSRRKNKKEGVIYRPTPGRTVVQVPVGDLENDIIRIPVPTTRRPDEPKSENEIPIFDEEVVEFPTEVPENSLEETSTPGNIEEPRHMIGDDSEDGAGQTQTPEESSEPENGLSSNEIDGIDETEPPVPVNLPGHAINDPVGPTPTPGNNLMDELFGNEIPETDPESDPVRPVEPTDGLFGNEIDGGRSYVPPQARHRDSMNELFGVGSGGEGAMPGKPSSEKMVEEVLAEENSEGSNDQSQKIRVKYVVVKGRNGEKKYIPAHIWRRQQELRGKGGAQPPRKPKDPNSENDTLDKGPVRPTPGRGVEPIPEKDLKDLSETNNPKKPAENQDQKIVRVRVRRPDGTYTYIYPRRGDRLKLLGLN